MILVASIKYVTAFLLSSRRAVSATAELTNTLQHKRKPVTQGSTGRHVHIALPAAAWATMGLDTNRLPADTLQGQRPLTFLLAGCIANVRQLNEADMSTAVAVTEL